MRQEPLCGHRREALRARGYRLECPQCGSFFDADFADAPFAYDESYPALRGHFEATTGAMKRRTLERWLDRTGLALRDQVVCEVGFGGAFCLRRVAEEARHTFGIEAVEANLRRARDLGVPDVCSFDEKPDQLAVPVDLWLFLDSFEHLPEPERFLAWMAGNSAPCARVLLVAPEARSPSERILGRLWPHRVPDHAFHWSRDGLVEIFGRHGFDLRAGFYPGKYVSGSMVLAHLAHKFPALPIHEGLLPPLERIRMYFNLGEMGLTLERAMDEPEAETAD